MIDVYHIVPIAYMPLLAQRPASRFLMAMAPVAIASREYVRLIRAARAVGSTLVLDNGTPYLGESIPDKDLAAAMTLLDPDIVVLPDVFRDRAATEARIQSFLRTYDEDRNVEFMGVTQGATRSEYIESYLQLSNDQRISHIGVPYMDVCVERGPGFERERFLRALIELGIVQSAKPHHLLGLGHAGNIELQRLRTLSFVCSCDTSTAYVHARLGKLLNAVDPYRKPQLPMDFDARVDFQILELLFQNVRCIDQCGG